VNIGKWITKWASIQPKKCAIIFEGKRFTYEEFNSRVNRLSSMMLDLGIKKGDRVGVLLRNSNIYIEAFFALSKIGAILVPLNFRLTGPELKFILNDSGAETLLFGEEFIELVEGIRPVIHVKKGNFIFVGAATPSWALEYEKGIERRSAKEPVLDGHIGGEDPHIIMYTSGTTGTPKGAILSHRKTFFNALNANIYYGLTPDDIMLISRPLFHSGGLLVQTAPMLYKGGTAVVRRRFRPEQILEDVEKYRVTVLEAAATMFRFILEACDLGAYDLSSLRYCMTGGERVPPSLLRQYESKGIIITQTFGQTETSTITWLPYTEGRRKLGSVGMPVFHADVKIVNKNGAEIQPGEIGEIIVSGPTLMTGYWRQPQLTAETIRDGWLHTGDLATIDEEGFMYIVDREKDMFISGGENVYPAEIEKVYLENGRIADVAIVGVPDEKWGEVGMAFIVLHQGAKMTEEEALKFCEGKIAKYKIPKSVMFVKELPRTAAQKIMRYKLREGYLNQKDLGKK
jgi:fatty-acyl-CoA synthase